MSRIQTLNENHQFLQTSLEESFPPLLLAKQAREKRLDNLVESNQGAMRSWDQSSKEIEEMANSKREVNFLPLFAFLSSFFILY